MSPTFAISLLERIKHLFDIDDVVFVIATDAEQLAHGIGSVYGSNFDATGYLRRFFDRRYSFEEVSLSDFVRELVAGAPLAADKVRLPESIQVSDYVSRTLEWFWVKPRDAEQIYDLLRTVVTVWDRPTKIDLPLLLPLIVMAHFGAESGGVGAWSVQAHELARRRRGELRSEPSHRFDLHNHEGKRQLAGPLFEIDAARSLEGKTLTQIFQNQNADAGWWFLVEGISTDTNNANSERRPQSSLRIYEYPRAIAAAGRLSSR